MAADRHVQVLIIGGGPGGYVAGIRAGQLGLDAVVVDGQPMGGTCLNVGCIPSKALIHAADEYAVAVEQATSAPLGVSVSDPRVDLARVVAWKDGIVGRLNAGVAGLLTKAGTNVVEGWASVVDGKTVDVTTADGSTQRIATEHLVIATGSDPVELPGLPFGDAGGGRILSSTEALDLTEVPEHLAVVGGGYIGLELGTALAKLGSSVTVVEADDRILPQYDRGLTAPVATNLGRLGIEVLTGTRATGLTDDGLTVDGPDGPGVVSAEKVLVTVGRRPRVAGFGLAHLGLTMDGGFIAVDERGHTSMRNVWAIGDVTGEPMLAHRAMKQGEVAAEAIAGKPTAFEPEAIPAIVFTDPEIVTVGLDPDQAKARDLEVVVGRFPLSANSRSMTLGDGASGGGGQRGFVRAVARADDHLIVGLQAVGRSVAELSAAFGLAIEMGARLEDVGDTIHAHPTVGESLAESALAALGHALHV
ncbi:MAG: dihydrolipoyl dehydrogenase [Actinomycetota bacterium]